MTSSMSRRFDVAVVGAGVFGAWTALHLCRSGRSVVLVDAFGVGNSKAGSGGESRVLRVGYGSEDLYSRWALRAASQWRDALAGVARPLFVQTGVLWLGRRDDPLTEATAATLNRLGVPCELLSRAQLLSRFPQFRVGPVVRGVLEPESGVILARPAVQTVVRQAIRLGVEYRLDEVTAPGDTEDRLEELPLRSSHRIRAEAYVFACGAWLPSLFPRVIGPLIQPTRQEVFFFGSAPGDGRLTSPQMPAWIDFREGVYGLPDLEGRGVKIGIDRHGPPFDPTTGARVPSLMDCEHARSLAAARIPSLARAPLLDARVCQYANTASGDFLIDRHPDLHNVWLVGGGSGHGFKHGPVVGEYVTALLDGTGTAEPRFQLAAQRIERNRSIY